MNSNVFLTAEWRKLLMLNYVIDPEILKPYLPAKTELDYYQGKTYVSVVGFMFQNTKIKGFGIPFLKHFEEVNLRFYVRYYDGYKWKRGVVFIKEIVPRRIIAWVANSFYGEHYERVPMKHDWKISAKSLQVSYQWLTNKEWQKISVESETMPRDIKANSIEEFITEHYWGYTKIDEKLTHEYGVEHPQWSIYKTVTYQVAVDFAAVYGQAFGILTHSKPESVFLAEGSPIVVKNGMSLG